VSLTFHDAEWLGSSGIALLRAAYESARLALRSEANLTDADLDALSDVMANTLLSLYRTGQTDETKLRHYVVAQTLRHLSANQR
jgi:hypothetical protein